MNVILGAISGVAIGAGIGSLIAVALLVEGKSGKTLMDRATEWCHKHLPW